MGDERSYFVPRFTPDNLKANMALYAVVTKWAQRKEVTPSQIALAWLLAQKPWIVPIPGTTKIEHMQQNVAATSVVFSADELREINCDVTDLKIAGARLPAEEKNLSAPTHRPAPKQKAPDDQTSGAFNRLRIAGLSHEHFCSPKQAGIPHHACCKVFLLPRRQKKMAASTRTRAAKIAPPSISHGVAFTRRGTSPPFFSSTTSASLTLSEALPNRCST